MAMIGGITPPCLDLTVFRKQMAEVPSIVAFTCLLSLLG
eukprot:gene26811-4868_t